MKNIRCPRTCRACGTAFPGGPRAWYCPECRKGRKQQQSRKAKDRARRGLTRRLGSTDQCAVCGLDYVVQSGTQKYCPDCAPEAVKAVDRAQSLEYYQANRESIIPARRETGRAVRAANPAMATCTVCGRLVTYRGARPKSCLDCREKFQAEAQKRYDAKRRGKSKKS